MDVLKFTNAIDRLSDAFGFVAKWLVMFACLISAGNATIRYLFHYSSNGWLEIQWYMFAGIVFFGASQTLRLNEHVRVDLLYGAISERARTWIDLLGGLFFLMPLCIMLIYFTWPWFVQAWVQNVTSNAAGGLPRWPVRLMLPLGFGVLMLQGIAEIIKCILALTTNYHREFAYEKPIQ